MSSTEESSRLFELNGCNIPQCLIGNGESKEGFEEGGLLVLVDQIIRRTTYPLRAINLPVVLD